MRKLQLLLAGILAAGICACTPAATASDAGLEKEKETTASETERPDQNDGKITAKGGVAEGYVGNTFSSVFFDFTVNSAAKTDAYEGITPSAEGNTLLIIHITMENTFQSPLPMFDTDFQITWGDGENDWGLPITYSNDEVSAKNMLAGEYEIGVDEKKSGDLVFEVPSDKSGFMLSYEEAFNNDEKGDLFVVYIKAQ